MQQPVDAGSDLYERSEIRQAPDRPPHHHAFLDLRKRLLLGHRRAFFQNRPPVHHHVLFGCVQLDDLYFNLLAHQLFHVRLIAHAAPRSRQERGHAHIHPQSALHHLGDGAADHPLVGKSLLEAAPIFGTFHFDGGKRIEPFAIHTGDGHHHQVSGVDLQFSVRSAKLLHGKDAVHFAPDVHEDGLRTDGDHGALHRLPLALAVMLLFKFRENAGERIFILEGRSWARCRGKKRVEIWHEDRLVPLFCHKAG